MTSKTEKNRPFKIGVITGSRAEYGLLYWLLKALQEDPAFELLLYVTGMHLSPAFGSTFRLIEQDGFRIHEKIETLLFPDTAAGISKSIGLGIDKFAVSFEKDSPDMIVILGDRTEVLAAGVAGTIANIPIAHIHGGEVTRGVYDDAIRHSLTKMSSLHFTATGKYRERVIRMGENPEMVFNVGGPGIENINRLELLPADRLEDALKCRFRNKNLLVVYHPETAGNQAAEKDFKELLMALRDLEDTFILFTMPNADKGSSAIIRMINEYTEANDHARAFTSMGQLNYLSALNLVDGIVGNSSSGIIEAPALKTGTVNIGDRQAGRIFAGSIISCKPDKKSISSAIQQLYTEAYRQILEKTDSPYGHGNASEKIMAVLKRFRNKDLRTKSFYEPVG
jgi:GDP/UDP-N,N'-diacetylbacillosamine 2-epimerase (hydrolysing)